ncbi:hypothetical protein J2046_001107 [Rhizobium petrolearium]|nr:hypothetical protein [Neorhizobium petrolearium]
MEIRRRPVDPAERDWRDIRANKQQLGAELLHNVELALGAVEGSLPVGRRHALEIAKGLE